MRFGVGSGYRCVAGYLVLYSLVLDFRVDARLTLRRDLIARARGVWEVQGLEPNAIAPAPAMECVNY